MKNSLFLRVFFGYAVVIVFLAGAVALLAPPLMRNHHIQEQAAGLEHLASVLESPVLSYLKGDGAGSLEGYVVSMGKKTSTRITVIDPAGKVVADSEKEPLDMENHLYRPEIFSALQGEKRMSVRFSSTLRQEMMYMSFPLKSGDRIVGVLRLSLFMTDLDVLFARLRADVLKILGLVTLLALGIAFFFTRSISRPVREFIEASALVAAGNFEAKVSMRQRGEFRRFARSFNAMTGDLKNLFREIRLQADELNSILASITEGLCVVDGDSRIVLCNDSFRRIVQNDHPEKKYAWEVVRSSRFAELMKRAKESGSAVSDELMLADRIYFCSVTNLAAQLRFVVTLHDMTESKNIERIKKDFVVNVTHELKTPLTAIKGFVEMLEPTAGDENRSYFEIIRRNTDRLIAIVEDLLVLSRLEEKGTVIAKEKVQVRTVVDTILKIFEKPARDKGLELIVEAGPDLPTIHADLYELERLLVNLVDNAVKYTDKGRVVIRLAPQRNMLLIEVADTGLGIDADHLPHIFERFYVIDKSRSKKLGGTGLGLSIVKHIVMAHQGTVSVKSRLGEGTTFTVSLPLS